MIEIVLFDNAYNSRLVDRDPGRWQLPINVQERRRFVFWEAYGLECSAV